MLSPPGHTYLVNALLHTPALLQTLLLPVPESSPVWDVRPDTDRFSLREIVAHLADWDDVWQERFARTRAETVPLLLRPDLAERAIECGYAFVDPQDALTRFAQKRLTLVEGLKIVSEADTHRVANLDRMGEMSLTGVVSLVLAHDAYHVRQVAEWLADSAALRE